MSWGTARPCRSACARAETNAIAAARVRIAAVNASTTAGSKRVPAVLWISSSAWGWKIAAAARVS